MAEVTLNQVNQTLLSQKKKQEEMSDNIASLKSDFSNYFKFLKESRLDELAESRKREKESKAATNKGTNGPSDKGISGLGLLASGAFVALVAAYTALKDYFGNLWKVIKPIGTLVKATGNLVKALVMSIPGVKTLTTAISDFFGAGVNKFMDFVKKTRTSLVTRFNNALKATVTFIDDLIKPIKTFFTNFVTRFANTTNRIIDLIGNVFKSDGFGDIGSKLLSGLKTAITATFDLLFGSFKSADAAADMAKVGQAFSDFIAPIKNLFSVGEGSVFGKMFAGLKSAFSFLTEGSAFMKTLGAIGKVIGRLAWPITIIMGVIDAVTGAFKGFTETDGTLSDKLIGGMKGAISGLYKGLIGAPLDLIKSAVSWIIGKFGFKDAEKALDKFKFTDLIHNLVYSPLELLKRAVNSIIEGIATLAAKIPGIGKGIAKKLRNFKFEEGQLQTEIEANKQPTSEIQVVPPKTPSIAPAPKTTGKQLDEQYAMTMAAPTPQVSTAIGQVGDVNNIGSATTVMTGSAPNSIDYNRRYVSFDWGTSG